MSAARPACARAQAPMRLCLQHAWGHEHAVGCEAATVWRMRNQALQTAGSVLRGDALPAGRPIGSRAKWLRTCLRRLQGKSGGCWGKRQPPGAAPGAELQLLLSALSGQCCDRHAPPAGGLLLSLPSAAHCSGGVSVECVHWDTSFCLPCKSSGPCYEYHAMVALTTGLSASFGQSPRYQAAADDTP